MTLLTNLVSYWKLDEASGSREDIHSTNDLTDNNTVGSTTGKINSGADFESANSETLSIADNASLSITGAMSLSLWVNHESLPAANAIRHYVAKQAGGGNISYAFSYRDDTAGSGIVGLEAYISSDGTNVPGTTAKKTWAPSLGTFYHIVMTYDPSLLTDERIKFYIDGSVQTLSEGAGFPASIHDGGASFRLGNNDDDSRYYDGVMDEVGIWSKALTAGEVSQLYNNGNGLPYPFGSGFMAFF